MKAKFNRYVRHLERGTCYEILGTCINATNGTNDGERMVRYYSIADNKEYVRNIDEFEDGRFVPITLDEFHKEMKTIKGSRWD